jgi:dynein heavy chain, axonemal
MSQALENIMNSFILGKIPDTWLSNEIGYPCLKPLASWFDDFLKRLEFMQKWLTEGPPISYWLSAFFFPQGFMTATLQTYARKTMTPIDTLAFRTNVLACMADGVTEKPEIGVNIHGLYMQGAKWDYKKKCVEDSDPKVAIVQFPVIWLEPIEDKEYTLEKKYQCPLYKTSTRAGELSTTGHSTNFVLFIDLPTETQPENWIRRGTALLCMTDE